MARAPLLVTVGMKRVLIAFGVEYAIIAALIAVILVDVRLYPILPYEVHKTLHVLGAVLFLGNIIVTAGWTMMATRSGDANLIRFAARSITIADVFFTLPGLILLLANAPFLASVFGGTWAPRWITLSLLAFAVLGVAGGAALPFQFRLFTSSYRDDFDAHAARRLIRRWGVAGMAATLPPFVILHLMVAKPT